MSALLRYYGIRILSVNLRQKIIPKPLKSIQIFVDELNIRFVLFSVVSAASALKIKIF